MTTTGGQDGLTDEALRALRTVPYEWNIITDRYTFPDNLSEVLGLDFNFPTEGALIDSILMPRSDSRSDVFSVAKRRGDGETYRLHYRLRNPDNRATTPVWLEDNGWLERNEEGLPVRAVGTLRFAGSGHAALHSARVDTLTGLPNQAFLKDRLDTIITSAAAENRSAALLIIGIDHFSLFNNVHGHDAGDEIVREIAARLTRHLRDADVVARFSGARLAVLLDGCNERDMLVAGYRIINVLRDNLVETASGSVPIDISIGGVVVPRNASTSRKALVAANAALAEARRSRETTIVSYTPRPEEEARRRAEIALSADIVAALREGRVHLAFQPVVDASSRSVSFFEALLRLENNDGSLLMAGDFVKTASRLGLIRLLDHHALDLAIAALAEGDGFCLSINVSHETAADPEWLSKLAVAALRDTDLPRRLIVEITESHVAESLDEARRFIEALHDLGFRVAVDDFGAGFTSFRNLRELDYDIIKIDGEFARDLASNSQNQAFIRALIGLAREFDALTVAEWVEDETTAEQLMSWGVDMLQGYWLGRPLRHPEWPTAEMFDDELPRRATV